MAMLKGKKILIAASQSAGASRHDTETVVASLAKSLVRHGATAIYGGNLDPKGFTEKMPPRRRHYLPKKESASQIFLMNPASFLQVSSEFIQCCKTAKAAPRLMPASATPMVGW